MTTVKYSFWIGLRKGLLNAVIFGLPILSQLLPQEWQNITLGGVVVMLINYVKIRQAQAGL